jgi:hypothetical protein
VFHPLVLFGVAAIENALSFRHAGVFVGLIAPEISSALRLIALQRRHAGNVSDRRFANAAFRFAGKLVKHVRAAAQSHPDLLRLPKSPLMRRFLLACVGKLVTVTTGVPFQRRLTNSRSAAFSRVRVISDGRVIFSSHSFSNRRLKLMATLRQRECGFVGHRSKKRVPNRRNALTATFIETA